MKNPFPPPWPRLGFFVSFVLFMGPMAAPCVGQEASQDQPRIGLVLSGGGARGCAHAGVLQVLEELRVPVHAIAGTSMGALIGGLYASVYDADEIVTGLAELDWDDLLSDQLAYRDLSLRRKMDNRRYGDFALGFEGGRLVFPSGLAVGQKLDFELRSLLLPVSEVQDFDQLPIPFRAVAANLGSGEIVVLGSGDLTTAIRASISIPGVLAPVVREEKVLIDGGLVVNLPVTVAQKMDVDVILAVDVGTPLQDSTELSSMFEVMGQALSLAGYRNDLEQAALADLLLRPAMPGVSSSDFALCNEQVAAGELAARQVSGTLAQWSLTAEQWESHQRDLRPSADMAPPIVAEIHVEGAVRESENRVRRRIRSEVGERLDLERIQEDLTRIFELGTFEQAWVDWEQRPVGLALTYHLRERSWGASSLRFGLYTADDLEGNNSSDVRLAYTRSAINSLGAEWRVELQIGRSRRSFTELYQPLTFNSRWFVAPSVVEERSLADIYQDDRKIAEYSVRSRAVAGDVGLLLGKAAEVRLGLRRGRLDAEVSVGAADLPALDVDIGGLQATFTLDRLDSPFIPQSGIYTRLSAYASDTSLGGEDEYEKVSAELALHGSRGRHGGFFQAAGGASPGSELPAYDEFTLGGILSLSGFGEGQLRGQSFAVGRVGYTYRLLELPPTFGNGLYFATWAEAGNVSQGSRPRDVGSFITAGTVALAADTRLGPIYLAAGHASGGFSRFYAAIGQRF